MQATELEELSAALGIGHLPFLSQENAQLQRQLVERQLQVTRLHAAKDELHDKAVQVHEHVLAVRAAASSAKHLLVAREKELLTESGLETVAARQIDRGYKDLRKVEDNVAALQRGTAKLEETIEEREALLELLDDEHASDVEVLNNWASNVDEYEEDILKMLRCQHDDAVRIKAGHLALQRLRELVRGSKATLEKNSTGNRMAQIAMDKMAEEFRVLHSERHDVMERWQEAVNLVKRRDLDLQLIFGSVNAAKEKSRRAKAELQKQMSFLANEKGNNRELQRQLDQLEHQATALTEQLQKRSEELDGLEGEIVLEERETHRLGADIAKKRASLNATIRAKNKMRKRAEAAAKNLEEAKQRRTNMESMLISAEDKTKEIDKILHKEERHRDAMQFELDHLRELRFKKESQLKQLGDSRSNLTVRLKALIAEKANLGSALKQKTAQLAKKEALIVANDYKVAQLEHAIARLRGAAQADNEAELKQEVVALKEDLEARNADKRNMDHLLHKIASDVRKTQRDLEALERSELQLRTKLEETTLASGISKRQRANRESQLQALTLEDKLLMVNERKTREEIRSMGEALMQLNTKSSFVDMESRREQAQVEATKEMLAEQQKHLRDDLKLMRLEIRERNDRIEKLKAKYASTVASLGELRTFDEANPIPSHAYHLVSLAQEKADLQEQCSSMTARLEKEERELIGLQATLTALTNSNESFRTTKLRDVPMSDPSLGEEVQRLKLELRSKMEAVEKLRNSIAAVNGNIKLKEAQALKCKTDLEQSNVYLEDRTNELLVLEKEIRDQEEKLQRALKVTGNLSSALKSEVPSAALYEQDMDLRSLKEKQRSALIRLRELWLDPSGVDSFASACATALSELGLSVPTPSRLESSSARSRSSTRARTGERPPSDRSRAATASLYRVRKSGSMSFLDLQMTPSTARPHKPVLPLIKL